MGPLITASSSTHASINGKPLICFGGCNYLGLAHHPRLIEAASRAAQQYGVTTSASRTTTGNTDLHHRLEAQLALRTGLQAALLTPEGMLANLAACQTASAMGIEHAIIDDRAHKSLGIAAVAAGLNCTMFEHGTSPDLTNFSQTITPCIILTDGVFTATGELADLASLLEALPTSQSVLLVDDCHGFPVLGDGRGSVAHSRLNDPRLWVTTSLAKGLGAGGGVLLATQSVIEIARASAEAFICTTPPSPMLTAAAIEALDILREEPTRVLRLSQNCERFAAGLDAHGIEHGTPITPIFATELTEHSAQEFAKHLADLGLWVPVMSYPGGPSDCYARVSINAEHTDEQIDLLIRAIASLLVST